MLSSSTVAKYCEQPTLSSTSSPSPPWRLTCGTTLGPQPCVRFSPNLAPVQSCTHPGPFFSINQCKQLAVWMGVTYKTGGYRVISDNSCGYCATGTEADCDTQGGRCMFLPHGGFGECGNCRTNTTERGGPEVTWVPADSSRRFLQWLGNRMKASAQHNCKVYDDGSLRLGSADCGGASRAPHFSTMHSHGFGDASGGNWPYAGVYSMDDSYAIAPAIYNETYCTPYVHPG